jgi:hypothetical protein
MLALQISWYVVTTVLSSFNANIEKDVVFQVILSSTSMTL